MNELAAPVGERLCVFNGRVVIPQDACEATRDVAKWAAASLRDVFGLASEVTTLSLDGGMIVLSHNRTLSWFCVGVSEI